MSLTLPKLIFVQGSETDAAAPPEAIARQFEVITVVDLSEAMRASQADPGTAILCSTRHLGDMEPAGGNGATSSTPPVLSDVLEHIAEGAALVDAQGRVTWSNQRFRQYKPEVQQQFTAHCVNAIEAFNCSVECEIPLERRHSRETAFESGAAYYEVVVSPARVARSGGDASDGGQVASVVGLLWENTASRTLQEKIDAIDAAGAELMHIEPALIAESNMAERLKLLEDKIIIAVRDLLEFDNFEIRLIDRRTNRLELVTSIGLPPLQIGRSILAEQQGNGISGFVAATGQAVLCPEISNDPRYVEGLPDAASSLTVPLRLNNRVIGVFNSESNRPRDFDENDRLFSEVFGRYIAMSMNILDLLVIERYTTNERLSANMAGELNRPLEKLADQTEQLKRLAQSDPKLAALVSEIADTASTMRQRISNASTGPRTILETDQAMEDATVDPLMQGKRIIIADDEPGIREGLQEILTQRGADVTICAGGAATIEAIEQAAASNASFDVVVSDIKMPDRNGYEVFRAARQCDERTQVILMTGFGYDPHHSIVRASQDGLETFLFKPFKASQAVEAIAEALEKLEAADRAASGAQPAAR